MATTNSKNTIVYLGLDGIFCTAFSAKNIKRTAPKLRAAAIIGLSVMDDKKIPTAISAEPIKKYPKNPVANAP